MGNGWTRVLDAVGGLVERTSRSRATPPPDAVETVDGRASRPAGALEARLAGVLVAALKEAFDRDSARLELERTQVEAERTRAEEALRAELRRQAAEQAVGHLRTIALIAAGVWALSAVLGVWLPGMRGVVPRVLLGLGWASAFASIGGAFAGWRAIQGGLETGTTPPEQPTARLAPWLLLAALGLIGTSLLVAL